MLATIQFRIMCLPVSHLNTYGLKFYRTVILSVALYGSESWSLASREEQRLRVSENKMLRPRKEE